MCLLVILWFTENLLVPPQNGGFKTPSAAFFTIPWFNFCDLTPRYKCFLSVILCMLCSLLIYKCNTSRAFQAPASG